MSAKGKIKARENFINILSSTEKKVKEDYTLKSLVNKTKDDFKKKAEYANTKNLYIDSDIYSDNIRKRHKHKTNTLILNNKKNFQRNSLSSKTMNLVKKSLSIGNINMLNNNLKLILEEKKNSLDRDSDKLSDDMLIFNTENFSGRKKFDKLNDLHSLFELIDTHEKIQYQIIDERKTQRLNMIRNKKKLELFQPSITYNKNNLIYKKKYQLIYDKNKNLNNIYIHLLKNKKSKKRNINNFNINSLSTETNKNCINILPKTNEIQDSINFNDNKTRNIYPTLKLYEPNQDSKKNLNSEITETREITPYANFSESNIFKTHSNLTSANNNLFKRDIILKKKSSQKKIITKVFSDVLENYKKIKKALNNNYSIDKKEKEDKKKNEKIIKNLIKKRKTNAKTLTKELNLNYDLDHVNLEQIVIDKRNKILERMKNLTQKKILKEIQQQVINEDLILSKKIILENNLEKKLNSRKKRLSEKVFEEMTLKRKQLKHHLIGFKLRYESDYINKLMNNEAMDFNSPKSLKALLFKYKTMRFN